MCNLGWKWAKLMSIDFPNLIYSEHVSVNFTFIITISGVRYMILKPLKIENAHTHKKPANEKSARRDRKPKRLKQ